MEHPTVAAEEEREKEVVQEEQQPINRPDTKEAAGKEISVKARSVAGVENDSGDEKTGEYEEETDAAPAPDDESLQQCSLQSRQAMV